MLKPLDVPLERGRYRLVCLKGKQDWSAFDPPQGILFMWHTPNQCILCTRETKSLVELAAWAGWVLGAQARALVSMRLYQSDLIADFIQRRQKDQLEILVQQLGLEPPLTRAELIARIHAEQPPELLYGVLNQEPLTRLFDEQMLAALV